MRQNDGPMYILLAHIATYSPRRISRVRTPHTHKITRLQDCKRSVKKIFPWVEGFKDEHGNGRPTGFRASQKWLDQDVWAQIRNRHRQTLERFNIGNDDIEADLLVLYTDLAPEYISKTEKVRAAFSLG
jgi:hypothetical protein